MLIYNGIIVVYVFVNALIATFVYVLLFLYMNKCIIVNDDVYLHLDFFTSMNNTIVIA